MPAGIVKSVVTLVVACLIVGLLMAAVGVDPEDVYRAVSTRIGDAAAGLVGALGWAWGYIVLGAVVVVPIWLLIKLLAWWRRD